jgi:predicted amidophosphoribosyltransferase
MTTPTATTPAPKRGFGDLLCCCCGKDAALELDLSDLETVHCPECEERFALTEVRSVIARWQRVLAWVDMASPQE